MEDWIEGDLYMHFFNRVLFFDLEVAQQYGKLLARVQKKGFTPGAIDILIAATAMVNGMVVATLNRKDFEQLGVEIVEF